MFTKLLEALKAARRTIVFTEGPDARILEATDRLLKEDLMDVILIGNEAEVKAAAEKGNFCICKATIIDPATYEGMDEMVAKMVELRKGKMSEEECRAALSKGNYFDYHNKYAPDGAQEICPAPIAPEETAKVQDAALRAHHALGLKGYSRADFILQDDGTLYILEVNTTPGMTSTSLVPREAAVKGMSFADLVERLLELALER